MVLKAKFGRFDLDAWLDEVVEELEKLPETVAKNAARKDIPERFRRGRTPDGKRQKKSQVNDPPLIDTGHLANHQRVIEESRIEYSVLPPEDRVDVAIDLEKRGWDLIGIDKATEKFAEREAKRVARRLNRRMR